MAMALVSTMTVAIAMATEWLHGHGPMGMTIAMATWSQNADFQIAARWCTRSVWNLAHKGLAAGGR